MSFFVQVDDERDVEMAKEVIRRENAEQAAKLRRGQNDEKPDNNDHDRTRR